MLKRLQERVNRGTKEADATAKKDKTDKPKTEGEKVAAKLAEKQLEVEEMARKVAEKLAPPGGN